MQQQYTFSLQYYAKCIGTGVLMWALVYALLAVPIDATQGELLTVAAAIVGAAAFFISRHAFFLATLALTASPREQVRVARSYTGEHPWIVAKVVAAPLAVAVLFSVLVESLSPDGRYQAVGYLHCLTFPLFWILACYNLVATTLLYLPDSQWHKLLLDPYRKARLTTLAMAAPAPLETLLKPKARWLLLVAIFVGAGNYLRLLNLPPAASVQLVAAVAQEHSVVITLDLKDSEFEMRGLRPIFFALGGERRSLIAKRPQRAWLEGQEQDDFLLKLPEQNTMRLHLRFSTDRDADELRKLEDLYLWYKQTKVQRVQISKQ